MGAPPGGVDGADEQHWRAVSEGVVAPDPVSGGDDAGKKR